MLQSDIADRYGSELATEEDFSTEYLDLIISAKTVENIDEAIWHINKYGSHHTDCIITEDNKAAEYFMRMVDSAGVYQELLNTLCRWIPIWIRSRGWNQYRQDTCQRPVGLEGLVTYKYKLSFGNGQIVGDSCKWQEVISL